MAKTVLLLTHSQDFYTIELVQAALTRFRAPAIRVNTDLFPEEFQISATIDNNRFEQELQLNDHIYPAKDIAAVWLRKKWPTRPNPEMDPTYQQACIKESGEVMQLFLHSLSHLPWMDPLKTTEQASNKYLQLQLAQKANLLIPPTLITNDPAKVTAFYEAHNGDIVVKMLTAISYSMEGSSFFMYTSKVTDEYMAELDQLQYCPMVFQQQIAKAYELRVIYVDGNFFTGKIDASRSVLGQVDWRLSTPEEVAWQRYDLPIPVCHQIRQLMQEIGLTYGAIDLIRNTQGDYVFLEVNPNGEWGMLQRDLDYPIAEAIAQALVKRL